MIAGLEGHLVSSAFIEEQTAALDVEALRRDLARRRLEWSALGPASAPRAILQIALAPLLRALGFDPPVHVEHTDAFVAATALAGTHAVAIVTTAWAEPLDPFWRTAVTQSARRSAAWCLLFNGIHLRLVDASRLYARRYLQFDIDLVLDAKDGFAALWQTLAAASFAADGGDAGSLRALVEASDRYAAGVCRSLRSGVLDASGEVLRALVGHRRRVARIQSPSDSFEQALTIVYRMLFLLFAEARALMPLWHPVYRESYSVESLRDLAERPRGAPGLWDALRAISRLAHSGCRAGDLKVTPFNGRLFAPSRTPLAERRGLDDEAARRAVLALSTRPSADRAGRERIAYRDLGVEQLGAVYETLLDYEPRIDNGSVSLECGSGTRKATGSFYTPQPIADYLVRRTLGPLVRNASPEQILQLRIVDPAMGSGAFLVAACRYLSTQYESALARAGRCHPSDIGEHERASIRRSIAERCLYGVDLNPMAVQLARLSLWLGTLAADRPLSFLDHRLQAGDSLLGAWLANLRHAPVPRRRTDLPLFEDAASVDALRDALPIRFSLESTPNDTLEQVREKERAFASLTGRSSALSRWKRVSDAWCAAWFGPRGGQSTAGMFSALSDAVLAGTGALPERIAAQYLSSADAVAQARRFFHWELEFPEVFFDRDGRRLPNAGFDAVLGNPPWDMIRADPEQHDVAGIVRFTRDSGIYTAQSDGHANRYQLFVERAVALTRAGGRIGLVLPSGLATDHGSAPLRRLLFSRCDVDAIVGMDNLRGVFPIHRSVRFLLVTASAGSATRRIACRFDVDDPAELESVGEEAASSASWFSVHVSTALLERISGDGLAIPAFRNATDLAIVERATALFPPLGGTRGWGARFGRELNATEDRRAFSAPGRGLPVVEGKHVEPFHVALDAVRYGIRASDARRLLHSERHERPRLAYRDVASATNRTTLIAAILPRRCVTTHTLFCLRTPLPLRAHYFLCALFNSLVVNFLVRLRVTTHVTTGVVEHLPVPTPESAPRAFREIAAMGRLLSRRRDARVFATLNARVAELYQLTAAEFEHVLATFPLIPLVERQDALRIFKESKR